MKKNIKFRFSYISGFYISEYIYLQANWKEKFFNELNKQFLVEYKKLNNEN